MLSIKWLPVGVREERPSAIFTLLNLGAVDRRIQSPLATAFEVHMTLERLRVPSSALCVFSRIVRVSALVLIGLSLSAAQESPAWRTIKAPSTGR